MDLRAGAMALLVLAACALMPIIWSTLAKGESEPAVALSVGLLAAGLCWAGGCALEGRRRGTVLAIAALGVVVGLLALAPRVASELGGAPAGWGVACAASSAVALALLARDARPA